MSEDGRSPSMWALALALVPTPLLLFVSPAIRLYVGNQTDLYHQSSVLLPFVGLAAVSVALGGLTWALSRSTVFRFLTWAHLLFASFLLAFRFLGGSASSLPALIGLAVSWSVESAWGLSLWLAAWLAASVVATRRFAPRSIANVMAVFALVLLAGDAVTLINTSGTTSAAAPAALADLEAPESSGNANVYHVVLDALQTEVVELLRSDDGIELDVGLGGFTYFPANRSVYHSTVMSLGSMFGGSRYAYDEPRGRFIEESFHERSMMHRFVNAGVWTIALVPTSDPLRPGASGFRDVLHHANNFERSSTTNAAAFNNLWIVANVPPVLLDWVLARGWVDERTRGELRLTRAGRALTDSAPVASAMSFRELVRHEERLPERGRYTFVHLLIPHSPYVLRADCEFEEWDRAEDPLAQTECTLALLGSFLGELDRLGRFDDSLIVVHGDHGAPFRVRRGALVRARARSSRTPLLIKPPGRRRSEALAVCTTASSLFDVVPTVLDLAGLAPPAGSEGATLRAEIESCAQ